MFLLRLPLALFNLIWQSAFLALGQIWANKTRAILTTLGIVIGVASVTAVVAALTGLRTNVLSEFESFGTNKIFVLPQRPEKGRMRAASWQVIRFTPEVFDGMLEKCPSVKTFTRQCDMRRRVSHGQYTEESVDVTGIEPAWHDIENRPIIMGRPFTLIDNEQARPVCLINKTTQEKLGLNRDPTKQSILIGDRRFEIVGMVESRAESAMFGNEGSGAEVFIPFKTARQGNPYMFMLVIAAAKSPDVSEEARAEIAFVLRKRRGIRPGEEDTFRIEAVERFVQQFRSISAAVTMVAGGVVGISLLVGGVGIMNIMLVSVSERTREIGLRKAVGARPSAILLQFLVEATVLCLMGGLIGVMIGQMMTTAMTKIPKAQLDKAYIPAWAVALSFGFAALVGVVFGMFPAIKAARLDPIEALRHE
jgi:putative ABC transport system permease protein